MLHKILILGEYLVNDNSSMIIGGKSFVKGITMETEVDEETFLSLRSAQENGWFIIKRDNYNSFLESRDREPEEVVVVTEALEDSETSTSKEEDIITSDTVEEVVAPVEEVVAPVEEVVAPVEEVVAPVEEVVVPVEEVVVPVEEVVVPVEEVVAPVERSYNKKKK